MKAYSNIEKTAFCKKGEYTGYANGSLYRIRKHGCGGWEAFRKLTQIGNGHDYLRTATLDEMSAKLSAIPRPE